ncbi:MAG: MBL fold metallo-hydrolase [Oscillospiraceae bacterium]|nr:MBL fold metallo-hydrolase [Oscillospiraceae bacterium]
MQIKTVITGVFHTNTYILKSGNAVAVIDPAGDVNFLLNEIGVTDFKTSNISILLTHGHFDHTSAVADLKEATDAKVYIHESDSVMLNDREKSFATLIPEGWKPSKADVLLKGGETIKIGDVSLSVMSTPGHSGGSVMYIAKNFGSNSEGVIFSGDTLFKETIGRVDGYGGSGEVQKQSLERIKDISTLDCDYRILPGHGHESTLKHEKSNNPYLLGGYFGE